MEQLIGLAQSGLGSDEQGYRSEFVRLMRVTKELAPSANNTGGPAHYRPAYFKSAWFSHKYDYLLPMPEKSASL